MTIGSVGSPVSWNVSPKIPTSPIVVAGDFHGELQWARYLFRSAHAAGAKIILQVGDLGVLWPGAGKGRFDGNHHNHIELRALEVGLDGLATVLPRIRYLLRAGRIVVQGLSIRGLGGAFSVDHEFRKDGVDWWPTKFQPPCNS